MGHSIRAEMAYRFDADSHLQDRGAQTGERLMQIEIFDAIHQQEKTYWWFVGRRRLVLDFFARYRAAAMAADRPKVLDMGCGTGGMLEDFAATASAFGTDVSAIALQYCRTRGQQRLCFADGRWLPFHDGGFDCIVALDVIEHIDDDL